MTRAQELIIHDRKPSRFSGLLREHAGEIAASIVFLGSFYLLMVLAANVSQNAIEPVASLSWDGRQAFISGPVACAPGETFDLQVILTQQTVEGSTSLSGPCSGDIQRWTVAVSARSDTRFVLGPARACTLGTFYRQGKGTRPRRWCRDIALLENDTSR